MLIPDGLFGLEYVLADGTKGYRFFALEAERTNRVWCQNLRQASWLRKVLAYRDIARQRAFHSHLGLPNLLVLVVTPTESRIEAMRRLVTEVTEGRGSPMFLFHHIPVIGHGCPPPAMPDLFAGPWARAGYEDMRICDR